MKTKMMSLIALLAAVVAAPAVAQETQTVWHTDGKRYWHFEEAVPAPQPAKTQLIALPGNEEGAILGFKYSGKTMQYAYFKEVPVAAEQAKKGHECSWRMVYENKGRTTKYNFCLVNGIEQPCPGMNPAGECVGKK